MAPLPEVRITPARVFSNSGLDYCGPFLVRPLYGRGASIKIYVACFICMVSKAMHLEIVFDLSSRACINAIKRFVGRRGRVLNLYCDNATTFVGANRELKEMRQQFLQQFKAENWNNFCLQKGITFHHIPARSPHFGGLWEAGVKSFKHHFRRIFGSRSFNLDEMMTAVVQIEGILNSRPLTPLSDNPADLTAITPGHLIIGEPLFSLPEPDLTNKDIKHLRRFQETQRSIQDFWRRWAKEYIGQLHLRTKWQTDTEVPIKEGTLVLLKVDQLPSMQWPLGRVVSVFPGTDRRSRVFEVQTARGVYKRALTEICVLPVDEPETNGLQELPVMNQKDDNPDGTSEMDHEPSKPGNRSNIRE